MNLTAEHLAHGLGRRPLFDYQPADQAASGGMLAGRGATSTNPDWQRFKLETAGKTPMVAPLSFGQYQGAPAIAAEPRVSAPPSDWAQLQRALYGGNGATPMGPQRRGLSLYRGVDGRRQSPRQLF